MESIPLDSLVAYLTFHRSITMVLDILVPLLVDHSLEAFMVQDIAAIPFLLAVVDPCLEVHQVLLVAISLATDPIIQTSIFLVATVRVVRYHHSVNQWIQAHRHLYCTIGGQGRHRHQT